MKLLHLLLAATAVASYWLFVSPQGLVMQPAPTQRLAAELPASASKWAYILGGSGGTGLGMAKELLSRRGFSVYITATSQASLDAALRVLRPLATAHKREVDGTVTLSADVDTNHALLKSLFESKNVRLVALLGFPESEAVAPIHNMNAAMVKRMTEMMTRGMADPLALALHQWTSKNQTGVFLGFSSNSAYCDLPEIEVYTAGRSFQTRLLLGASSFLLSTSDPFASDRTRKVLVANVEVPVVDTNTAKRYVEKNPHMKPVLDYMAWNPDTYAQRVLHRVLDLGHTNVVEGVSFRLARMLHKLMPLDFGPVNPALINVAALIDPALL